MSMDAVTGASPTGKSLSARSCFSPMKLIEQFIFESDFVSHVETMCRLAVLLFPSNSPRSELYIEGVYAMADLLSTYGHYKSTGYQGMKKDAIKKIILRGPEHDVNIGSSERSKLRVDLLESIQLVLEMAAMQVPSKRINRDVLRWNVCILIELLKYWERRKQRLVLPVKAPNALGDAVYLVRPVAYVILLRIFGMKSWWPYLISLALDIGSERLPSYPRYTQKEASRYLLYAVRSPVFDKIMPAWILRLPLVSHFISYYVDLQHYYFSTS